MCRKTPLSPAQQLNEKKIFEKKIELEFYVCYELKYENKEKHLS